MVTSLLKYEKIRTTDTKAKAIRAWVDHLITLAKRGDLHARRQALSIVREKSVVHKLFAEAEEKFGSRNGGYTRITKLGNRKGDAAPVSIIELITEAAKSKKKLFKEEEKKLVAPTVEKEIVEDGDNSDEETLKKSESGEDADVMVSVADEKVDDDDKIKADSLETDLETSGTDSAIEKDEDVENKEAGKTEEEK
jgi:large subunit ribosomal protein L17